MKHNKSVTFVHLCKSSKPQSFKSAKSTLLSFKVKFFKYFEKSYFSLSSFISFVLKIIMQFAIQIKPRFFCRYFRWRRDNVKFTMKIKW